MILNDPNYGRADALPNPPLTWRDAAFGLAVLGLVAAAGVWDMHITAENDRALAAQQSAVVEEYPVQRNALAEMPLTGLVCVECVELPPADVQNAVELGFYRADIPLAADLQDALRESCALHGVPVPLALGLIETESNFVPDADNGTCYGLCQLNRTYYPDHLAPEDNIRCGVAHLAEQLERYGGDISAALTAYNAGYDTGSRTYANAVLAAAEKWEELT